MTEVALVDVKDGDILAGVIRAIDLIGGLGRFVRRGDLVVVKPNLFVSAPPETGRITHPEVILAIAKLCHGLGARVVIGERTRNVFLNLRNYPDIWDYADVISFDDTPLKLKQIPGAKAFYMSIVIPRIVDECDVFINVPGLRTHALSDISNGLKNLMGILPGDTTRFVHHLGLSDCIVDLNVGRPSDLTISDAIYTLHGNFPVGGKALKTNLLLASDNIVAIDATAARFLGFEPSDVEHLREASARGLGPISRDEIRLLGPNLDEFKFTFSRAEHGYEKYRKLLSFVDPAVCKNCRQAFASGLVAAVEEVGEERVKGIRVVLGPIEKPPSFPKERVLLYGSCTRRFKEHGLFISGCPPLASQAKEAILTISS
ncbi:MAG: DUF362 domain-containing protein [Firmicutes bacterium]|nr:DUF362 domain-containing protein [Bacillota bacterium]